MTDYIMHIQFEVNIKSKKEVLMKTLIDYNKQSYLVIGHIFDIIYNIYNTFFKIKSNTQYIMPVKQLDIQISVPDQWKRQPQ